MKKILVSLLALALALSMAACNNDTVTESESEVDVEIVENDSSEDETSQAVSSEDETSEAEVDGEDVADTDIVGKWVGTTIEAQGMTLSIQEFTEAYGMEMEISFEFKADGTVVGIVEDIQEEGTYEVNGSEVSVTFDGETEIMTLEEAGLVLEMDGIRFIMTK